MASGRPLLAAASVELLTVTAEVRLRRSNMRDDIVDELAWLAAATAGREWADRVASFILTRCLALSRSHVSINTHGHPTSTPL